MSFRVVVAGAGITGLAAAFTLQQQASARGLAIDLVVLDAGSEPGGNARTIDADGFLVERGPNGFLDRGAETMALVDELNLRAHLVEANPAARRRFILQRGALRQVPESPPALIRTDALGWRGKLRLLREPWASPAPRDTDETVFAFAERRLGREAAETFVDTAVAGISAGDSRMLSVRSQFPILKQWERDHGSLLKAMLTRPKTARAKLVSFDRGMGRLTSTLATRLNGAVRIQTPIDRVEKAGSQWRVSTASGPSIVADALVFALPSHAAARTAEGFDHALAAELGSIPYAGMSMVAMAYQTAAVGRQLDGYGYLVTRSEDLSTLGVLWESSIFPGRAPDGSVLLRVMLGGARRPEVSAMDDETVARLAVAEASRVLGIASAPHRQWVCRFPAAIAQYNVGHDTRTSEIRRLAMAHRGLHLCGTAYDGVSFNDAVASGRKAALTVIKDLAA